MASFDIERTQGLHNEMITAVGNSSASNDPKQHTNDATEILIKGAAKAAAGRELGLSDEETLAVVSRQSRKQKRAALQNEEIRQWNQKQKSLGSDLISAPETDFADDDFLTSEAFAFGYDQDDTQTYTADDKQFNDIRIQSLRQQQDDNLDDDNKVIDKELQAELQEELSDLFPTREGFASKEPMRRALADLQLGLDTYGPAAMGGEVIDAADRLKRQLEGGIDLERQRFLAKQTVEEDSARFNPEVRRQNEAAAQMRAISGFSGASTADEAIGRIAEIRKLGGAGSLAPLEMAQVIRTEPERPRSFLKPVNGVYIDPNTNNPVAVQGPMPPASMQGANTPDSSQIQNAPRAQNATTWMQANLPSPREGGRVFNDYPQVDITLETTNFANKVKALSNYGLEGVSDNIRSLSDIDRVTAHIIARSAEMGKPLYTQDPTTGKEVVASKPGVQEVMSLLRMTSGEQQRLANAMFQMQMASDEGRKAAYESRQAGPTKGVEFDAREALNNSGIQSELAQIPRGSTIKGPDGKRQTIVSILSGLPSSEAQKPFMAQVKGEKPRINRRKPGNMGSGEELEANIRVQAEKRAKGKPINEQRVRQNQVKARLAEQRELRDSAKREEMKGAITDRGRFKYGTTVPGTQPARNQEDLQRSFDLYKKPFGPINPGSNAGGDDSETVRYTTPGRSEQAPAKYNRLGVSGPMQGADLGRMQGPEQAPAGSLVNLIQNQANKRRNRGISYRDAFLGGAGIGAAFGIGKNIYDSNQSEEDEKEMVRY